MTLNLTLGVDPGLGGAIAVLADGAVDRFIDTPTKVRQCGKGDEQSYSQFVALSRLRGLRGGSYSPRTMVTQVDTWPWWAHTQERTRVGSPLAGPAIPT